MYGRNNSRSHRMDLTIHHIFYLKLTQCYMLLYLNKAGKKIMDLQAKK